MMIKRITLLRRKDGMDDAEFRAHWAEPHAKIAMGFEGLARYNQNRVDAICWQTGDISFDMHGIVELWFTSQDAVTRNATSATTRALIEDEPRFLSGLTALSVGESWISTPSEICRKYMIFAVCEAPDALAEAVAKALPQDSDQAPAEYVIDTLAPSFTRKTLSSESVPPTVAVTVWTRKGSSGGLITGEDAALRDVFITQTRAATAYLVDELRIV